MIYVLLVKDDDGGWVRMNTAPHSPEWREALQEQADRIGGVVVTEREGAA